MLKCPRCKSDALPEKLIRYSQQYEGNFYIIDHVPAQVCEQCGEIVLSEAVAEKIQTLIWSGGVPARIQQVPVYELV